MPVRPGNAESCEAIVLHNKIRKISFTGGPITARKILAACAEEIKPSVMELGGKSASLVFPDCDLQAAAERAVFWTVGCLSGQGCALPTRHLATADVYDDFVARPRANPGHFQVGYPTTPTVARGPAINPHAATHPFGPVAPHTAQDPH